MTSRQPVPDLRWPQLAGDIDEAGEPQPMSFAVLADLADTWEEIIEPPTPPFDGPAILLRTARSLFAHAWFDYEFLAVACLVGFQALEAAFRLLYPENSRAPARRSFCEREKKASCWTRSRARPRAVSNCVTSTPIRPHRTR